jgi:hypothetical protein
MSNGVFFPQDLLDILMDAGKVDIHGEELVLPGSGYRYEVEEAVRVLREVTTGEDPLSLCGKVTARTRLSDELGAEILGNSMLIEESAYDVVPGFVGKPLGEIDPAVQAGASEADVLAGLQNVEDL